MNGYPRFGWVDIIRFQHLVEKIKAISNKEGIPIRYIVEQMFKQGIIAYEAKHGEAKPVKRSAEDLFL